MQSDCCLITRVILHEAILGQILFNVLINNMDDGVLSKFVDVIKYREVVSVLEGTAGGIFSTCWRNELPQNS